MVGFCTNREGDEIEGALKIVEQLKLQRTSESK